MRLNLRLFFTHSFNFLCLLFNVLSSLNKWEELKSLKSTCFKDTLRRSPMKLNHFCFMSIYIKTTCEWLIFSHDLDSHFAIFSSFIRYSRWLYVQLITTGRNDFWQHIWNGNFRQTSWSYLNLYIVVQCVTEFEKLPSRYEIETWINNSFLCMQSERNKCLLIIGTWAHHQEKIDIIFSAFFNSTCKFHQFVMIKRNLNIYEKIFKITSVRSALPSSMPKLLC